MAVSHPFGFKGYTPNSSTNRDWQSANKFSVRNLHIQISAAVTQREVTGIINCCSGKPVALADKVEEFIKEHNFKIKLNYGAFPDRPYDSPAVWGSREKIDIILKNCGEL